MRRVRRFTIERVSPTPCPYTSAHTPLHCDTFASACTHSVARILSTALFVLAAGGGSLVAGYGCMQTDPAPPMVYPDRGSPLVIPYTRTVGRKPLVQLAVAAAAPLMGYVAERVGKLFPETTAGLAAAVRCKRVVGDTFMYPTHEQQRRGLRPNESDAGSIAAHQLAMRLAGHLHGMENLRQRAHHQHCAIHLDSDDAEREHGCPLTYALYREQGVVLSSEMAARPMRSSDLVVFEHENGGRCVRIQTACQHHIAVVILSSDTHLHANVFPDSLQDGGQAETPPGIALLRLVPYGRKGIDDFVAAVERQPELWKRCPNFHSIDIPTVP